MMSARKRISVCIPVFNEAQTLPLAVDIVEKVFAESLPSYELELIVTDNGSLDETWEVIRRLAVDRSYLHAFRFSRNFGYQNSVFAGISLASGDAVVELDADLEDPPEVIVDFVKKWEKGFDVVYGVRRKRHGPLILRFLFWLFYKILHKVSDLKIPENSGDFRLLDRKIVNVLKNLPERNLYLRGLITYLGFRQAPILYDRHPRKVGRSKFRLIQYLTLAADGITALSKTPLRAIGVMGFLLFGGSAILGIYYFVGALVNQVEMKGFTTIVVLLLLLHGMNFVFVGVIGEYLSRIFDDSKGRPRAIISDSIHGEGKPNVL